MNMRYTELYDLCCRYNKKSVRIKQHDGRVHVGTITRVSRDKVWIMPSSGYGGFGLGFFGGGFGIGIALGAIAGIALTSAFFW